MPEGTKRPGTDTLSKYDSSATVNEGDLKEGERRRSGQRIEKEEEKE